MHAHIKCKNPEDKRIQEKCLADRNCYGKKKKLYSMSSHVTLMIQKQKSE